MFAERYDRIILCEPHCRGFEHSQFNAALIASVRAAFPGSSVLFMGEESHLSHVRGALRDQGDGVVWRGIEIENPASGYLRGTCQRVSAYRAPFRLGEDLRSGLVLYCSVAPKGVLLLKAFRLMSGWPKDVLAVFHNQLAQLAPSPLNELRLYLTLPQPRSLKFVVLGGSIRKAASAIVRFQPGGVVAIDLPSLLAEGEMGVLPGGGEVRFGFLGVSLNKGFDEFLAVARELKGEGAGAEFSMVGVVNHGDLESCRDILPEAASTPLGEDEYIRRGRELTYVVWTAAPGEYEMRGSATFVDALSFGKPGIYLRNRYIEHYFGRFGDIGYLCDDLREVSRVMREVSAQFPAERYRVQIENIRRARESFAPSHVGEQIRGILTSAG